MAGRSDWEDLRAFMELADGNRATLAEAGLAEIGILFARRDTRIPHPSGERLLAAARTYAVLRFASDGDARERGNPHVDAFLGSGPHWSVPPTAEGEGRHPIELLRDGLGPHHHRAFDEFMRRVLLPVALAASWHRLPAGEGAAFRYVRLRELPDGRHAPRRRSLLARLRDGLSR